VWNQYISTTSVEETLHILRQRQGRARLIAGGTDLLIDVAAGKYAPECLVDTTRVPELETIGEEADFVVVGANVTFHTLWTSPLVNRKGHALAEAARHVAAWLIQNVGTLAGNVVTAQPAGDGSIALVALGAQAEIATLQGRQWIDVAHLYAGPGVSKIDPTREMITRFRWRQPSTRQASAYERIAKQETLSLPIACCGIDLELAPDMEHIAWARIAIGPVADTPFRATCAEDYLSGAMCEEQVFARAAEEAASACAPRTSRLRATREYRTQVIKVIVQRGLARVVQAARTGVAPPVAGRFVWNRRWHARGAESPLDGRITFTLNGRERTVKADPGAMLADVLREELGLTGTKIGCDEGECGACTVLVDDQPVASCLYPVAKAHGRQVRTIEGMTEGDKLHPVQQALVDHDAIQCGYCTPGMVMAGAALLEDIPDPTPQEIKEGIGNNFCRCTGYVKIVEAIEDAAGRMRGVGGGPAPGGTPRKDAVKRVTGRELYAADMQVEGMLHGKLVWSQYPHAEILSIDTSEAERVAGVVKIITHRDVPGKNLFGSWGYDQPALAEDRVLFLGDVVAVVYAETLAAAEEGVKKVRVEYRELPGVFSPQDGLRPDAPVLKGDTNVIYRSLVEKGDIQAGFAQADIIIEDDYSTQPIEHAFLETESGIGVMEDDMVTIYQATQWPPGDRQQLADILGLPLERIRIVQTPTGGAFGGKMDLTIQPFLALGTYLTGRPVKIVLKRPESIRMHVKRHPFWEHYKLGATREGKFVALQAHLVLDSGAYRSTTDDVLEQATVFASGPYVIPHVRVTGVAVRTNNVSNGAMRGFGANQVCFAMESHIDQLARALNMSPFEMRRINMLDVGTELVTGQILQHSVGAKLVLKAAEEALRREKLPSPGSGKRIGVGVAAGMKNVGLGIGGDDSVHVSIELQANGSILLREGAIDMGQGANTVMCKIASREMGVAYDLIEFLTGDTAQAQDGGITAASRQTFITGRATLEASQQFKAKLLDYAGRTYGVEPDHLMLTESGEFVDLESERLVGNLADLGRIAHQRCDPLSVVYHYQPAKTFRILSPQKRQEMGLREQEYINYPALCYMCHVAIVEVDEQTGHVNVLKLIAAHDVGKAIIPSAIEGQIQGGVVMGLGYALTEEFVQEKGWVISDELHKIAIPRSTLPTKIVPIIVEDPDPGGPFGAKGLAEAGAVATAPAVTNAIYDAMGVRVRNLPATKDKVLLGPGDSTSKEASGRIAAGL